VTLYKALGGGWSEHEAQNADVAARTNFVPSDRAANASVTSEATTRRQR
jgi:hypothetical protein